MKEHLIVIWLLMLIINSYSTIVFIGDKGSEIETVYGDDKRVTPGSTIQDLLNIVKPQIQSLFGRHRVSFVYAGKDITHSTEDLADEGITPTDHENHHITVSVDRTTSILDPTKVNFYEPNSIRISNNWIHPTKKINAIDGDSDAKMEFEFNFQYLGGADRGQVYHFFNLVDVFGLRYIDGHIDAFVNSQSFGLNRAGYGFETGKYYHFYICDEPNRVIININFDKYDMIIEKPEEYQHRPLRFPNGPWSVKIAYGDNPMPGVISQLMIKTTANAPYSRRLLTKNS